MNMVSKEIAYFAMVRSTLKYSSDVWDPYLQKDIDNVKRVNQRAARFVLGVGLGYPRTIPQCK